MFIADDVALDLVRAQPTSAGKAFEIVVAACDCYGAAQFPARTGVDLVSGTVVVWHVDR